MSQETSPLRPARPIKKKRRTGLYVILALVALVVVGGVAAALKNKGPRPIAVTTEKAVIKTITQLVSATGRVQPEVEVKISGEVAGEIIELPVVEGQAVKPGDLLARIRPDFYQAQVEQARASVSSARAGLLQGEAQAEKARLDFAQVETLFKRGLVPETEFNSARSALRVSEANVEAGRAALAGSESSLNQSLDLLRKTTIYAPRAGTISILNCKLGERVVATGQFTGTEIMRIADLQKMEVRVNVNENDVINVKIGDPARVRVDAFQGRVFKGAVREIANTARTAGASTQDEVTNFEVRISIQEPEGQLRPGMSATADVETQTAKDVVAVPIQSVTVRSKDENKTQEEVQAQRAAEQAKKQGEGDAAVVNEAQRRDQERRDRESLQRVVFVRDGKKVRQQKVETGILDNTHIEIRSGLKVGDEVVSGSFGAITRELKDGALVLVAPAPDAKAAPAPEKKS
jgi:HlyD family secretion protein